MSRSDYCLDANIFITAWNVGYPISIFPSLWKEISLHKNYIVLITPIYDEIDPMPSTDNKLPRKKKKEKFPLNTWLKDNHFFPFTVDNAIKKDSLILERKYQIHATSKGAGKNDMTLIAYAHQKNITVVTFESVQTTPPKEKCKYKIPLICEKEDVDCITFIEMIRRLGITI